MLRRAVAIYLVLMTAAGPNLCCCSTTHLFANQTEASSCCKEDTSEIPPCCQPTSASDAAPVSASAGKATSGEEAPRPCPEQCPCRKSGTTPATVASGQHDGRDHIQSGPHAFITTLDLAASGFIPTGFALTHTPQSPAHFLCGEQILYVFHQLRC